jgi:hypothetical protein
MQPLPPVLTPWHDFYALLGEASATMVGLLFVAASVGAGVFSQSHRGALRMFLSASVVQFGCILAGCLIVLAPVSRWDYLGGLIVACGVFGLAYSAIAWRDALHDRLGAKIDLEDRIWYVAAPVLGYCVLAGAGIAFILRQQLACSILGAAMGALLLVAVHNAWDITVWSITRHSSIRKDDETLGATTGQFDG